jgi:hypothetical protein
VTFYANAAATALRMLTSYGQSVTLTRSVPGAYNTATGATATATVTTTTGKGVLLDYAQRDMDGTLIREGDQRCYASLSVVPLSGDTLTAGGVVFEVVASRTLAPAGTAVLHDMQLRGVR